MNKFLFKSSDPDLSKIFSIIETKLEIQSSNILYITHQIDKCLKTVSSIQIDLNLQKTVDQYFDDSPQNEDKEPDQCLYMEESSVKFSSVVTEDYIRLLISRIVQSTKPGLQHALTEVSEEE